MKAKELQARLEMMITMYGKDCEIATFSDTLSVFDENGEFVQEINIEIE